MSGGEEGVKTLDAFTKCRVEGCEVNVMLTGSKEPRCWNHGGPDGIPEYLTLAGDGSFIYVRHMTHRLEECE